MTNVEPLGSLILVEKIDQKERKTNFLKERVLRLRLFLFCDKSYIILNFRNVFLLR